MVVDLVEKVGP